MSGLAAAAWGRGTPRASLIPGLPKRGSQASPQIPGVGGGGKNAPLWKTTDRTGGRGRDKRLRRREVRGEGGGGPRGPGPRWDPTRAAVPDRCAAGDTCTRAPSAEPLRRRAPSALRLFPAPRHRRDPGQAPGHPLASLPCASPAVTRGCSDAGQWRLGVEFPSNAQGRPASWAIRAGLGTTLSASLRPRGMGRLSGCLG